MARKYRVEGTRDFLYWSILLCALGLWAVKDGWFPSGSTLEKHPRRVPAGFETGGVVAEIGVVVNDDVRQGATLAVLQRAEFETRQSVLAKALDVLAEEARLVPAGEPPPDRIGAERARLNAQLAEVRAALEVRELKAPTNGTVVAVLAERYGVVRPRETVVEIDPRDHFYAFNKSLALLSLVGAAACAIIHLKVR
jgi:multidrug resistance efflux pump